MGRKNGDTDQQIPMGITDLGGGQPPPVKMVWKTTRASALGNVIKSISSGIKVLDDRDGLFLLMEIKGWCDKQIAEMRARGVG